MISKDQGYGTTPNASLGITIHRSKMFTFECLEQLAKNLQHAVKYLHTYTGYYTAIYYNGVLNISNHSSLHYVNVLCCGYVVYKCTFLVDGHTVEK